MQKLAAALAAALVLPGCVGPALQHAVQPPELPARWAGGQMHQHAADVVTQDWWRSFGSAELDGLIAQAQRQSWDVAAAVARVHQARASARHAGAALFPEVTAELNAARQGRLDSHSDAAGNAFKAGLSASYELDFWGRNASARDAAQAALQASVYDRDTVRLTVTAAVASAWLGSQALQEREGIAQANLATAQRLLQLVEARARLGAATAVELAQQRGLVAAQQRTLALLRQQQAQSLTALALLLGQAESLALAPAKLTLLNVPDIQQGEPAALLTRRPDIARAEASLAAAQANLQVARAAMLPRVTLSAQIGSGDDSLRRVFDNPLYTLAAGLAAPIFDAGRLAADRDLADARREELLAGYRQTIVQAFGDVQSALHTVAGTRDQAQAQAQELAQARKALTLAEARYRAGGETLMSLLATQQTLYQAQDLAVQLHQQRLLASVGLYKALGGGWEQVVAAGTGPGD
ncbi:MAG: efflux transporter outer membrane subunit [Acidovorax sp.]|jgi:NodT family efflux transporter outer membrane factor (OMF) lipoprotein|nr:efflux transporter outer membrane subunit [Acidovorax sp.]